MKKEFISYDKERVLGQLLAGYKREEKLDPKQLEELEQCLTKEELEVGGDSLAIYRVRSLFASGRTAQAYSILVQAMQKYPQSISLLTERRAFLSALNDVLADMMHQDTANPTIEKLYAILASEAYLSAESHLGYLKFLIGTDRLNEAAKLAVPLSVLYPSLLHLRECVEKIVVRIPHPTLSEFLTSPRLKVGREYYTSNLNSAEICMLKTKLENVRNLWRAEAPIAEVESVIKEAIGEVTSELPLDSNLKEFYYLQGILEEKKQNYFRSLLIFRSLVEMDPCNLAFRQSMDHEITLVCKSFVDQAKKGTLKSNLVSIYPILKEIGLVSYELLIQVCLAEAKQGLQLQAKERMAHLISLNPMDNDFIEGALSVAEALGDSVWCGELIQAMRKIGDVRKWDLDLRMKVANHFEPFAA